MAVKEVKQTGKSLLTISEACQVLGVSEAALRQWTDEGKVKAFVTPGGHRRYAEAELRSLMKQQTPRSQGLRELGDRMESVGSKEREVAHQYMQSSTWYPKLDEAALLRLRERGKRLVAALATSVTKGAKDEVADSCRKIGQEYGNDLASLGLTLTDSIEAFILHRNPVIDAVMGMMSNAAPVERRALNKVPQINKLIDMTLIALVETHQRYTAEHRTASLEGD